MIMKKSMGELRFRLLGYMRRMKWSNNTIDRILLNILNMPMNSTAQQKEEKAEEILKLLEGVETEEEALERIKQLTR